MRGGEILPQRMVERSGIARLDGLLSDGKVIVDALYKGAKLESIESITIHVQHERTLPVDELRERLNKLILAYIDNLQDALSSDNFISRGLVNLVRGRARTLAG